MRSQRDRATAFVMVLPSLLLVGIFVYGFIFRTIQTSMSDWGVDVSTALAVDAERNFIGLQNYENIMTDLLEFNFRNSLVNTFYFTIFFVGGCLFVGLLLALLLDQDVIGEAIFRTVFLNPFLPKVIHHDEDDIGTIVS